jgi:hypothetical protein
MQLGRQLEGISDSLDADAGVKGQYQEGVGLVKQRTILADIGYNKLTFRGDI